MSGSVALDVVIGLIFVFLLYSLLASVLSEMIANFVSLRARVLMKAITRMLNKPEGPKGTLNTIEELFGLNPNPEENTLAKAFYNHSLIKFLAKNNERKPAYLASTNFSKVMIDLLTDDNKIVGANYAKQIHDFLYNDELRGIPIDDETKKFIKSLWADAQGDVDKFRALLEKWFDDTMERTSGWYKKYTQIILFSLGLCIAILFNVDAISIADKLKSDPKLRQEMVQRADNYTKAHPNLSADLRAAQNKLKASSNLSVADSTDNSKTKTAAEDSATAQAEIAELNRFKKTNDSLSAEVNKLMKEDIDGVNDILGLGYESINCQSIRNTLCTPSGWMRSLGWILTALAISLGAPFWFDMLNKLMQLRSAVKINSSGGEAESSKGSSTINRKG